MVSRLISKPITRLITGTVDGQWGGESTSNIEAKVGTFTTASGASQSVTGLGMQPELIFPFTAMQTAEALTSFLSFTFGWALGPSVQGSVSVRADDNQATSEATSQITDDDFIQALNVSDGGNWLQGRLTGFTEDGFDLDWSEDNASRIVNYAALRGFSEANVSYHQFSTGETSYAHGLTGGAPDFLLFITNNGSAEPQAGQSNVRPVIGAYDGTNQFLTYPATRHNLSTTDTKRATYNNGVSALITTAGIISKKMAVIDVDATNVNCEFNTAAGGTQWFAMLAIRGIKAQVGLWDTGDGSTDPKTIYTPGMTPKLFLPFICRNGSDSVNTTLDDLHFGLGASDGTSNVSVCVVDEDDVTTTNNVRNQENDAIESVTSTTLAGSMTASFSGQSVELDVTSNTSNWLQGAYIVLGQETTANELFASVGTSTSPTSTGTKAVTGVGFQPKALIDFGINQAGDGTGSNAILSFGAATSSTSRGGISVSSKNGQATSDTSRRHDDTVVYTALNDGGNEQESADLESFDSDGFTRDWESAVAFARTLNHICLGGSGFEASLTLHQMNGTGADESFAHGLTGGAPTALLIFASPTSNALPVTNTQGKMSIGAWAGGNQFNAAINTRHGDTTTECHRVLSTAQIFTFLNNGGAVSRTFTIDSVDATNVNITEALGSNTTEWQFNMLALRGCAAQVGTFDCNASADPLTISCSGITPKLFLPVFGADFVDNIGTVQSDVDGFTIGAFDGTNNVSCGITDQDGQTTTNAARVQRSARFEQIRAAGGVRFAGSASFDGESVILDPSQNSGNSWGQGAYLILGDEA